MRTVTIPAQAAKTYPEQIELVSINPNAQFIHVSISEGVFDTDGTTAIFTSTVNPTQYTIVGDDWNDLMSATPSWGGTKPAGRYREEDLWEVIDIIRNR